MTSEHARFEDAALRHLEAVYRFAFYLTRNEDEAQDLAQDTFTLAFQGFRKFRGKDAKTWLLQIARNAWIDRVRKKRRGPDLSALDDIAHGLAAPEKGIERWTSWAIDGEGVFYDLFGDEVNRHIAQLPSEFRIALLLCDIEELSYREISEVLGCPVGTVRSRISRAREELRERLYEYARGLGFVKQRME